MITVTGATGQLGRAIVEALATRLPTTAITASCRDPGKAEDLTATGIQVRQADYDDPESLRRAFDGAEQVLLVSSNAAARGGDPLAHHRTAIEAARAAKVRRIVYTSHMGASASSAFPPMHDHHATEEMLRDSGLAWTALRNGFYAASSLTVMAEAFDTGHLEAPQDGTISWTAHADLAEAAATILVEEGRFDGPTPPLTGSEALSFTDLAAIATDLGRAIRRETLSDEGFHARIVARGVPEHAAKIALGMHIASRNGEFATTDPTLANLIDRPPISMRSLIAERLGR
ncbi:NAD(P)H-binding protein [Pseudoruegeria sp. HB172150]|uniref:NAD(P)H-binding protein n=1 Tax=Pseudoruegeria sp. HB172150 TaxID=2721164 RepID=UPI00155662AF|nr:NAD(P)H-binding protein [Pseudoruegeria sp. HB172150]